MIFLRKWARLAFVLAFFMIFSCSKKSDSFSRKESANYVTGTQSTFAIDEEYITAEEDYYSSDGPVDVDSPSQMLIKRADISFETENMSASSNLINGLLRKFSAYILDESSNINSDGKSGNTKMVIKVPAVHFESFIDELYGGVGKFSNKHIYTEDVTTQVIDNEARLKVKRETENRYLQILQKANTVSDILEVENELQILRSSIESIEAQLKYLKNQIAYSTIDLYFYTQHREESSVLSQIGSAFADGAELGYNFILGLIYLWPLILILVVGILLIRMLLKKRPNTKKEKVIEKESSE